MEIETIENARYYLFQGVVPELLCRVNGQETGTARAGALRFDRYAAVGLGFSVIVSPKIHSPETEDARHIRLEDYTNDRRYVALVREFVEAVDNGRFRPGPVEIPE